MTLDPILAAPAHIQAHIAFALVGVAIGPFALFRGRRDRIHKLLGRLWVLAIIGTSVTGLLIESEIALIGTFGPIHLFSFMALWGVAEGVWHIRRGNVAKHRASMQSTWFGAMGLAGIFTLLPGRTMNAVVFGGYPDVGYWVVGIGVVVIIFGWRRWVASVSQA